MAFSIDTLSARITKVFRRINAEMPGADAALSRNNLNPVAKVIAAGERDLFLFGDYVQRQMFIRTCDGEMLDDKGAEMKPAVPRKQASQAAGTLTVTVTAAPVTIASGATFGRSDGVTYVASAGAVLAAPGSYSLAIEAVLPGAAGNAAGGTALVAASGVSGGTASYAAAASGLGGGADLESDDDYRQRLLFANQYPDHGGAPPDYHRYATEVPGVTRAFIDPLALGAGTVVVYPLLDASRPGGIPTPSDLSVIRTAMAPRIPSGCKCSILAATPRVVNVTIAGLSPATPEVRVAVQGAIAEAFARLGRVAGLSTPHPAMPFLASAEVFSRSWLWQAIANATGEERHNLTVPAADISLLNGELAVPGTVTFA